MRQWNGEFASPEQRGKEFDRAVFKPALQVIATGLFFLMAVFFAFIVATALVMPRAHGADDGPNKTVTNAIKAKQVICPCVECKCDGCACGAGKEKTKTADLTGFTQFTEMAFDSGKLLFLRTADGKKIPLQDLPLITVQGRLANEYEVQEWAATSVDTYYKLGEYGDLELIALTRVKASAYAPYVFQAEKSISRPAPLFAPAGGCSNGQCGVPQTRRR